MLLGLLLQILALFFETIHLYSYSGNGEGFVICEVFAKILGAAGEVTITLLILFIMNGWTITYEELDFDENLEIYLPIGAVVVLVQIIVAAVSFIDTD